MCSPETRRHTRSSTDFLAGASFQCHGQVGHPVWAWVFFGFSPGTDSHPHYKPVLGPDKLSYVLDHVGSGENIFYVEGLAFPDVGFSGLVSFSASLLEVPHQVHAPSPAKSPKLEFSTTTPWCISPLQNAPGTPIFTDTVVFRVAPWIMTPNTQQPLEVFVCR